MAGEQDKRVLEALVRVEAMGNDITEIKDSIRKMSEAMVTLARIEERQAQDREHIARLFKLSDDHDARIRTIEDAQPLQRKTTDWVDRAIWVVVSAVLTALVSMVVITRAPAPSAPSQVPTLVAPK